MRGFRWLESDAKLLLAIDGGFVLAMLSLLGGAYLLYR